MNPRKSVQSDTYFDDKLQVKNERSGYVELSNGLWYVATDLLKIGREKTGKWEKGDIVFINPEWIGTKSTYGTSSMMKLGGDGGQPLFDGPLMITSVDQDNTVQLKNGYWYHEDWLSADGEKLPPTDRELLESIATDMAVIKELLGIVEQED